ncbi:hypothetical protein [Paenibacillus sp. B2(2019)]|uniref:hypothetical protein n=1 Tax=Paenibacillus sp. B2(2019) TaxID=2607754 RepID=UPI0021CF6A7C|nr:hypothetical protein [Paenibacillus sp. B2(2019)]
MQNKPSSLWKPHYSPFILLQRLGDHPTQAELHAYSSESQMTSLTPPTFIWTTANDASVPVENKDGMV